MKKALLIGINYIGTSDELQGCIDDVNNVMVALINLYKFDAGNITLLSDAPNQPPDKLPTKANILSNMAVLVKNPQAGDSLVLYYSGHGTQLDKPNAANPNNLELSDDAIVPMDFMTNGVIIDDAIFLDLAKSIPKDVNLNAFFDSCNSGSIADLEWNFQYTGANKTTTDITKWDNSFKLWQENNNTTAGNVSVFSGCYDDGTSADTYINSTHQGAFSYCLLNILSRQDPTLKYRDLLKEVNAYLYINGFTQRSQFSCSNIKHFDDLFTL
jgi:hypothetical protein